MSNLMKMKKVEKCKSENIKSEMKINIINSTR